MGMECDDRRPAAGDVDGPPRTARADSARTGSERLRGVPADLTVYAALAGREPRIDPSLADPLIVATAAVRATPWSPAAVGVYVLAVARAKGVPTTRPAVTAWLRRQSAVARRRLAESRRTVSAPAFTVAVDPVEAESDA